MTPTHADLEALLGAYALDAVEPDEREAIDHHLPTCAKCRSEVQRHREVAALLAHTGASAPDGLWQRIAASLDAAPPDLELSNVKVLRREPEPVAPQKTQRSWAMRLSATVLAAAATVIVVLGVEVRDLNRRTDEMERIGALERGFQQALGDPGSELVELTSADGRVSAHAVLAEDGGAYLQAEALPPAAQGRVYQLWGDTGSGAVSLGLLGADPGVVPFQGSERYVGFGITEEQEGGAPAPTQEPVVEGTIT